MANTQDELCPDYVGASRITLTLDDATATIRARSTVFIDVNYDDCDPEGVVLPLVLTVTTERGTTFTRTNFTRTAPTQVSFVPREGGLYTVRLAEFGHNRWFGSLTVTVLGDRLTSEE
jgi:hypothetical protein